MIPLFLSLVAVYLILTLIFTYILHDYPRRPVLDPPDWGRVLDTRIPTVNNKSLEVWRIEPDGPSKGIVVFAHGWTRNRDRMISRARMFGRWGYATVIHSARDHGGSSPQHGMNALRFAEDIEAVLSWIGEPAILYGHSAGSGGAIITAWQNPDKVKLLFMEGVYPSVEEMLTSLFRWYSRSFSVFFGRMILFWMKLFYRSRVEALSPARLAPELKMPVMIIHGEKDGRFPLSFAFALKEKLPPESSDIFIGKGANHSGSSKAPGYEAAVLRFLEKHRDQNG
ncbi:MAG: alpha/beta hydrolase [Deltaproteobacteria bacterium]|nr:alpha/beta hydrolase [Deltaproteobacteria bacterium]